MTLGSRIKKARKAKKMTQADLGRHFGISSQAVSQWENDPTKGPQRDKMGKLARLLEVDLTWLSGDTADTSASTEIARLIEGMPDVLQRRALRLIRALVDDETEAA